MLGAARYHACEKPQAGSLEARFAASGGVPLSRSNLSWQATQHRNSPSFREETSFGQVRELTPMEQLHLHGQLDARETGFTESYVQDRRRLPEAWLWDQHLPLDSWINRLEASLRIYACTLQGGLPPPPSNLKPGSTAANSA